jgi:ferric-dicitrate binding protein FerR (iron transport regulator)
MTDLERSINREVTADMLKDTVSPKFKPRIRVILESNVVVVSLIAATAIIAASFIFYNLSTWLLSPQQQCYISGHKQFGEKFVHLPDQSIVILSAGSELCSDKDYGVKGRKVFLSGEGYFEVVTNAAQPFYIETDGVLTTVTGTGLNVKNDRGKELVIVSVTHGKVSVCYNDEDYSVMPGYELSIRKQDSTVTLLRFDPSKVNWKYPSLSFNNITLDSTFKKIEQHFHMRVLCSNSVPKQCKFFGEYEYNDVNPDNILNMIGKMYKLEYKIKGDTIFVMGDGNCKGK